MIHRGKDELCAGRAEIKACREKMRREKMNDRHVFVLSVFFCQKRFGVVTYFCFIFKRKNKIRKKTLNMTHDGKSGSMI